jgi:DNA-binding MarR family transcriptional regulator
MKLQRHQNPGIMFVASSKDNVISTSRLRILRALGLAGGQMDPGRLSRATGIHRKAVSSHLTRFQGVGLITYQPGLVKLRRQTLPRLLGVDAVVFDAIWDACSKANFETGVRAAELAAAAGLPKSEVSAVLARLVTMGWVETRLHHRVSLAATPSARVMANQYLALHDAAPANQMPGPEGRLRPGARSMIPTYGGFHHHGPSHRPDAAAATG